MTNTMERRGEPPQIVADAGVLRLIPSVVTSSRIVITAFLVTSLLEGGWGFPFFAFACITDLVDGALARRLHAESGFGGVLDASADFLLVLSTSTFLVWSGLVQIWFLPLLVVAFIKFIVSRVVSISDPLGKHIGTVLFFSLGTVLLFPNGFVATWATSIASCYILASIALSLYGTLFMRG